MKTLLVTIFLISFVIGFCQSGSTLCNCIKKPAECIPELSKREVVRMDTVMAHHSFCYLISYYDKLGGLVYMSKDCTEEPTHSNFYDASIVGLCAETWYDTSGKFVYFTLSQ